MDNNILRDIEKKNIDFFQHHTNFNKNSKGFGLTQDNSNEVNRASIAATGFMLSSLIIGVEINYLDKEEALFKAKKTLETLVSLENFNGFFPHFVDKNTSEKWGSCEYSTIDTILCVAGVLSVDNYFDDEEINEMANKITNRIKWEEFIEQEEDKLYLRMAYNPSISGDYVTSNPGFISRWDMLAEQLMMYPMIAGSISNEDKSKKLYAGFSRTKSSFDEKTFYSSPHNTLFVYHLPLCWLDVRDYIASDGIDWVENTKLATQCHQYSSMEANEKYKTFTKNTFGMNASDTIDGYRVYGALPNIEDKLDTDGTIAPYSIICSLPYIYDDAIAGVKTMKSIDGLYQRFGFMDAYNYINDKLWISNRYIAIDKGMELLSVNQITNNIVRNSFMNHPLIIKGMKVLEWKKRFKE